LHENEKSNGPRTLEPRYTASCRVTYEGVKNRGLLVTTDDAPVPFRFSPLIRTSVSLF